MSVKISIIEIENFEINLELTELTTFRSLCQRTLKEIKSKTNGVRKINNLTLWNDCKTNHLSPNPRPQDQINELLKKKYFKDDIITFRVHFRKLDGGSVDPLVNILTKKCKKEQNKVKTLKKKIVKLENRGGNVMVKKCEKCNTNIEVTNIDHISTRRIENEILKLRNMIKLNNRNHERKMKDILLLFNEYHTTITKDLIQEISQIQFQLLEKVDRRMSQINQKLQKIVESDSTDEDFIIEKN